MKMKNNKLKFLIVVLVFFLILFFINYKDSFGIYKSNLRTTINLSIVDPSTSVTVTLDLNDGTGGTLTETRTIGQELGNVTTPTRTDHNFLGWYDGTSENANRIYASEVINAPVTFYAHWQKIVCKKVTSVNDLNSETCEYTANGHGCLVSNSTGYSLNGITNIVYGTVFGENSPVAGDAYNCDVNNNGNYDEVDQYGKHIERFYYIDEKENQGSGNTAVLMYYTSYDSNGRVDTQNTPKANVGSGHYSVALGWLPTASTWTNPYLIDFDSSDGKTSRFLNVSELIALCGSLDNKGEADSTYFTNCFASDPTHPNWFMFENSRFQSSNRGRAGIWLGYEGEKYYRIQTESVAVGNYTSGDGGENMARPVIEIPITALEGYVNAERYTISFNTHGGTPQIPSINRYEGQTLGTLIEPTLAHNDFAGWYAEETYNTLVTSSTVVNSNMTLHAKWTPRPTNTVTLVANGGTIDGGSTYVITVDTGSTISVDEFPEVVYAGETLEGWYTDSEFENEFDDTVPITSNITLYAKWENSNYVARIGNTPYETLAAAVAAVADNLPDKTTITILDDITLTATIAIGSKQNIELAGGTHTISGDVSLFDNKGKLEFSGGTWNTAHGTKSTSVVLNRAGSTLTITGGNLNNNSTISGDTSVVQNTGGTINMTGGTLTGHAQAAAINNKDSGKVNVSGGSIYGVNSTKGQAIYLDSGTVTISGTAYLQNASLSTSANPRAAADNDGGTMIITGGTIVATNFTAVENRKGTTTIGVDDGIVNTTTPVMRGKVYGFNQTVGTVTICDGIFESLNNAVAINHPATGTGVSFSTVDDLGFKTSGTVTIGGDTYHTAYLDAPDITVNFYEEINGTAIPVTVENSTAIGNLLPTVTPREGYYFGGWFINSDLLQPVTSETIVLSAFDAYARWVRSVSIATMDSTMSLVNQDSDVIEFVEDDIENVTYSSSNTNVVTVDSDGTVHAVGVGSATITITGTLSSDTRTVTVTVTPIMRTVTFTDAKHTTITREVADGTALGENMPATSTDENYVFSGWTVENTMTQFTAETLVTGDVTVVANWKEKITYASLTLESSPLVIIIGDSGEITITETVENDTIENFTVTSDDSTVATVTKDGNTITVNGIDYGSTNVVITGILSGAQVTVPVSVDYLRHTVTFKDGTTTISEISVIDDTAIGVSNMPADRSKENYFFDGWFIDGDRTKPVTGATTVTGDMEVFAGWTPTIQLATIPTTHLVTIGTTNTIHVTDIPEGMETYTFSSADSSIASVDSTTGVVTGVNLGTTTITVTGTRSEVDRDITVTVDDVHYTVTFLDDDNVTSYGTASVPVGNGVGQNMISDPTKPNHIFAGWTISGGLVPFTASTEVNGDITVVAVWKLELNGATITTTPDPFVFKKGKTGQITLVYATNGRAVEDCTFTSSNTNIAEVTYSNNVATVMGADVGVETITITGNATGQTRTVTVTIDALNTITFDPDNGNVNDITTIQVADGSSIGTNVPSDPTKTGYTFDRWYLYDETNEVITTTPLSATEVINSDRVYKARWADATDVAAIGTVYYPSIAHAIDAAPTETPTEIRILQDIDNITCTTTGEGAVSTDACFAKGRTTVPADKEIIIEGGKFTVECGASTVSNVIYVKDGTLRIRSGTFLCAKKKDFAVLETASVNSKIYIEGGTIRNENNRAAIYNPGEVHISGGTISTGPTVTIRPVIQNTANSSKVYMSGGTVIYEATSATDAKAKAAISVGAGRAEITGGTVITYSADNSAVYSEGTLIIGTKNNTYDATSPVIQGENYGISSSSGKKYEIYDGIIKGKTAAVDDETKINKIETGTVKVNDTDGDYKTLYYQAPVVEKYRIEFNANEGTVSPAYLEYNLNTTIDGSNFPTPTRENHTFDGWYTDSTTQTPFTAITPSEVGTTVLYAKWTFNASLTPITHNILSNAMQDYFTNVSSWVAADATDLSNQPLREADATNNYDNGHHMFLNSIDAVFTNNNCSSCNADNNCNNPDQNKTYCDYPAGYDTGISDNLNVYSYENDTKGDLVTYTTSTGGVIYNMIPGKTYLWESTVDNTRKGVVSATGARRTLKTSIRNLRDLGGLSATNSDVSGTIDYGRLYRGAQITSSQGVTDLTKLGVTREVDLRQNGDGNQSYKMTNYDTGTSDPNSYTDIVITNYIVNPIATPYITDPHDANYDNVKSAMRAIMEKVVFEHDSIFFHCTIGTDRTGTIAYFLEGLLGVSEEDRLRDYELTYFFGLTNRTRFHDSVSWSSVKPRFYSMYRSYPTNADIYNYYTYKSHTPDPNNQNDLTDDELLRRFRLELIH